LGIAADCNWAVGWPSAKHCDHSSDKKAGGGVVDILQPNILLLYLLTF
jgi:hypothetical protein